MSSARNMWAGFMVFLICSVVAVIMFFSLGLTVDNITDQFYISGVYEISDPAWDDSYYDTTEPMINIFYFFLYLIPVLGLGIFIFSGFRKYWNDLWINANNWNSPSVY